MAINKIIVDGVTKIDLSQDTVTEDKVLEGMTFHDATGSLCTGTMKQSTGSGSADVGDITLYTKEAFTYNDYVSNSGTSCSFIAYYEDGTNSDSGESIGYIVLQENGRMACIGDANDTSNLYVPINGKAYVVSTKKITSVDVNWGGGCGS